MALGVLDNPCTQGREHKAPSKKQGLSANKYDGAIGHSFFTLLQYSNLWKDNTNEISRLKAKFFGWRSGTGAGYVHTVRLCMYIHTYRS